MYQEIREIIESKTKNLEMKIYNLKQIENSLEEKEVKAIDIFEGLNNVNEIEAEMIKDYKSIISDGRDSSHYYCEDLQQCLNNFELQMGIIEKQKQFIEEVKEAKKIIDRIKNKTF